MYNEIVQLNPIGDDTKHAVFLGSAVLIEDGDEAHFMVQQIPSEGESDSFPQTKFNSLREAFCFMATLLESGTEYEISN